MSEQEPQRDFKAEEQRFTMATKEYESAVHASDGEAP